MDSDHPVEIERAEDQVLLLNFWSINSGPSHAPMKKNEEMVEKRQKEW